jgi:anhydro-N-acetylmuramic acid kinase
LEQSQLSSEKIIATFTEHIAVQLSRNIENNSTKKVLVTGGGAFNSTLIKKLQKKTKAHIVIPNKNLVEYKEALIFGLLGVLKLNYKINVLASVTGALKDHCAGKIFQP